VCCPVVVPDPAILFESTGSKMQMKGRSIRHSDLKATWR
jgi:hypothetical protein